ncbi:MAG: hypothetical protein HY000_09015 [Planctomycetes bacterium]|nr:hypothetical protein [Planctomycetota bacterium]
MLALSLAFAQLGHSATIPTPSDVTDLRARHEQLRNRWMATAKQLAERHEFKGQTAEAEAIRQLIEPPTTEVLSISVLPSNGQSVGMKSVRNDGRVPTGSVAAPSTAQDWQVALAQSRKQHAMDLFELARVAFQAGEISYCYELVREVVEHDPDHGAARNLLGYTRYGNQWVSPYAATKLKAGQVWDPRFGWVPKTHVPRLEKGERLWKGQWLAADEVAKYRQEWANAWEIETEHYLIRTNTSLERGAAFADKLEKLYAIFFRLFAGFFNPRDQIALLFDTPNRRTAFGKLEEPPRRAAKRFRVHFYRTREQYLEALRPHIKSGLEVSTGIYVPATRTAYFFLDDSMDESTVIHEATHQLFSETRDHQQAIGTRGNYWAIEGIACYMESFHDLGDRVELGSWDTPRLKVGRERIQRGDQYLPIDKLVRLGMNDFQGPAVYAMYTESACLCRFLMHYDNGRYREGLVRLLEQVYLGKAGYETLAELTDTDYTQLERQFREHVGTGG